MSKLTKKQKALVGKVDANKLYAVADALALVRWEEHTSALQSRFGISYAVFCLHNKNKHTQPHELTSKLQFSAVGVL